MTRIPQISWETDTRQKRKMQKEWTSYRHRILWLVCTQSLCNLCPLSRMLWEKLKPIPVSVYRQYLHFGSEWRWQEDSSLKIHVLIHANMNTSPYSELWDSPWAFQRRNCSNSSLCLQERRWELRIKAVLWSYYLNFKRGWRVAWCSSSHWFYPNCF